jgi:hypothetical protein
MHPAANGVLARALAVGMLLTGAQACAPATAAEDSAGVGLLFIGNSLTYTNELPAVVARLAQAAGEEVTVDLVAGPNLAVVDHTNGATNAIERIDSRRWSFVVLQQGPTPAGVCRDTLIIAAMRLAPHIRQTGARAVLFLPWARQDSPQWLDFASESATLAARATGGVVAPIGVAWKDALTIDPTLPLYGSDGYHPAPAGTLLAALTLYDRLSGRDVRRIPLESLATLPGLELRPSQLQVLANAAHGASASLPPDSPAPALPDTTKVSSGGGPC